MLRTSAKVNLALEVLGKRADGYHEIATVMQAVDLFDRLTVETARHISLETRRPALPTDDRNLVVRAARLLREAAGVEVGARIGLDKRIPVAAGLGGGSSDAAATLWGLNRLWGLRWRAGALDRAGGGARDGRAVLPRPRAGAGDGARRAARAAAGGGRLRAGAGESERPAVHARGVRARARGLAGGADGHGADGGGAQDAERGPGGGGADESRSSGWWSRRCR